MSALGFKTPKLILLPGLDGTGKLFEPLVQHLPAHIDYEIYPLNQFSDAKQVDVANEIAERLGNQEVILFAESYSGRIAYALAQNSNLKIKHIIFAASFLQRPSPLSRYAYLTPLTLIKKNIIPVKLLNWALFGNQDHDSILTTLFMSTLKGVSNTTLRQRLKNIAQLNGPKQVISVPCTYIQATNDKLVPQHAIYLFQSLCKQLNIEKIEGGHFIAQSSPRKVAEIINKQIA
ncbi:MULTISPECIES: alpha/beta fold hydrolase [unclassified Pseudoalteromonas]|uniref:alpha/beta fold hydrolase n=1 Tax=unclassified Pseudoalteromonas TaxID=194690 RepID=UPI000CF72E77|nr:alpha/beta fold hydrolase [Pseudoalteromonas sp. T1lg75]MBS3799290.1 alpha/beta hydrolase [Pseudoalteromonas sp. BDTF-M6]